MKEKSDILAYHCIVGISVQTNSKRIQDQLYFSLKLVITLYSFIINIIFVNINRYNVHYFNK